MMNQSLEWTGRTVEEAIQRGLDELGLDREDVDVDVLSEGRSGLLGLRSEDARVRLRVRQEDDDDQYASFASLSADAESAREILAELLRHMDVDSDISVYVPGSDPTRPFEPGDPIVLDVEREDAGLLIGRRGQTLRHVQMLLNTIVSRSVGHYVPLRIDVEGYQQRHIYRLQQIALRAADHVRRRRRPITLDPMSPADRRIIHMTLANNPAVITGSTGHGENRRVTIQQAPRGGDQRGAAPAVQEPPPSSPAVNEDEYEDDDYFEDEDEDLDEYDDEEYDDDDYDDEDEYDDEDYDDEDYIDEDEEEEDEPPPR
jgi:spoIIIJ-associated protein